MTVKIAHILDFIFLALIIGLMGTSSLVILQSSVGLYILVGYLGCVVIAALALALSALLDKNLDKPGQTSTMLWTSANEIQEQREIYSIDDDYEPAPGRYVLKLVVPSVYLSRTPHHWTTDVSQARTFAAYLIAEGWGLTQEGLNAEEFRIEDLCS